MEPPVSFLNPKTVSFKSQVSGSCYLDLDKLRVRCRSGTLGCAKSLTRAQFWAQTFCLVKNKKQKNKKKIDLKVFSRIGKTKTLQRFSNAIMGTSLLIIF